LRIIYRTILFIDISDDEKPHKANNFIRSVLSSDKLEIIDL